ncbi:MAG TPA: electron transfer flavoprotein subunit alpha/FixB family protein [Candidatus Sphingobacterium stercorigallinarum]|nr:electron transfer flavoprotein subunit alpha/FixB family protein [Candidatus Sphingobacterium stercorigallinarum]
MAILVYIEHSDGKIKKSALETISYAKAIAEQTGEQVVALSIGSIGVQELKALGNYGASKVLNVTQDALKQFANQAYANIIQQAVRQEDAKIVVLAHSFAGKGLAPRLAAKLSAGYANGAMELPEVDGAQLTVKVSAFSNKAFALKSIDSPYKVISVTPNAFEPRLIDGSEAEIVDFSPELSPQNLDAVIQEIIRSTDKVSLPEAEIVVSAGRGLKGPENWAMIEELADALGAATACSKPVSDAGWRPHSEHVGQTGIVVSPNLYIAIGISGAIQHLAGVSNSKTIVVINQDPDAPFFKVADYGIVGDAFQIVPQLTQAIKNLKHN